MKRIIKANSDSGIKSIECFDIEWDTDGEDATELGLPESVTIENPTEEMIEDIDGYNDSIVDYLSDEYGYLVKSFSVEPIIATTSIQASSPTNKGYLYLTKHGVGPGTLPKDVKLLKYKDLSEYITAIWLDRFLTTKELDYYDIYPETGMNKVLERNGIDETVESLQSVTSADDVFESSKVKIMAGYHEILIYVDDVLVYAMDEDCTEDWFEYEDKTDCAELYVDSILEEFRENESWDNYELVKENKKEIIKALADYMVYWTE